jgi:hypothetical protein
LTVTDATNEFPPDLFALPSNDLTEEPETSEVHRQGEPTQLVDLGLRVQRLEDLLETRGKQTGSGVLNVFDLPVEDTSEPTPRLVWTVPGPLTCQSSKGRNLEFKNFQLHIWNDARIRVNGPFYNTSRHSNWDVTVSISVWYRSGHSTRPIVSTQLWFGEIRNGHIRNIDSKFYSDKLASLYSSYRAGELYVRFGLYGERTN